MKQRLTRILPIVGWLSTYGPADLRGDLASGITVGIMLIPQGMAYALLAGMPPIYGLYAALVPLVVYALLGTSRHLSVGTTAIDSMIMVVGLGALAETGTDRFVELAFGFAVLVGAIHLALGVLRLGFLVNLLSRPVILGFTSAAALIIGFSQLSNLVGIPLPRTEQIFVVVWEAGKNLGAVHFPTLVIGFAGILLLVLFRRWKPLFPRALTVVVIGTLLVWLLNLDGTGVQIVGDVPRGLPAPIVPSFEWGTMGALFPTALALALIQFTNVVSLGKVFAARHKYSIDANRELFAIGAANVIGALFQSFTVSGSYSRTAVAEQAGAKTALSNVFAAALIVLTLLILTPLFYHLPVAVLAAIIMVAAFGMIDIAAFRYLYRMKPVDGGIALLTFAVTVVAGLQVGILTGIAVSVVAIMYRISRPNVAILGRLPGTRSFRDVERHVEAEPIEGILLLRMDASFTYANAEFLKDLILNHCGSEMGKATRAVIIDMSSVNDMDTTAVEALQLVVERLGERDVLLYFAGVHGTVREMMQRSGFHTLLGSDHFYLSPHRAVESLMRRWGRDDECIGIGGEPPSDAPL